MTIRVVVPGLDEKETLLAVLKAMRDPDVEQVIVHRPGSHLRLPDGKEVIVTSSGGYKPAPLRRRRDPEPVGAC